ncbi:MAG: SMI1/KNR4 family protein [Candidatus Binatia bacterium]
MITLPTEFVAYWSSDHPKEGSLGVKPGWFQLWRPDQVREFNEAYEVAKYAPGFLAFGSNGGAEMLAFDTSLRVFMVPFVGMHTGEAILVAESWDDFVSKIEQ